MLLNARNTRTPDVGGEFTVPLNEPSGDKHDNVVGSGRDPHRRQRLRTQWTIGSVPRSESATVDLSLFPRNRPTAAQSAITTTGGECVGDHGRTADEGSELSMTIGVTTSSPMAPSTGATPVCHGLRSVWCDGRRRSPRRSRPA